MATLWRKLAARISQHWAAESHIPLENPRGVLVTFADIWHLHRAFKHHRKRRAGAGYRWQAWQ